MPYPFTLKKLSWESSELATLKLIKNQLLALYTHTDTNIDQMSKESILGELAVLSSKIEEIIRVADVNIDTLIKRDSDLNNKKVCSHCESHKLWICDPCMDKMAKELDERIKKTNDSLHS